MFPFIRQSIRSDYCAVYATAMYLTLLGCETDRRQALLLFGAKRGTPWPGASHSDMLAVIRCCLPDYNGNWRKIPRSASAIRRTFQGIAARGSPALITAYCRHRTSGVECGHAFLVTGFQDGRFLLLDPLGLPPLVGDLHNASAGAASAHDSSKLWPIERSAWDLIPKRGAAVLQRADFGDAAAAQFSVR